MAHDCGRSIASIVKEIDELRAENTRLLEEIASIRARQVAEVADRIDSRSNAMVVDLTEKLVAAEGTIIRLKSELRYLDRRYIGRGDQILALRVELKAARTALEGGA